MSVTLDLYLPSPWNSDGVLSWMTGCGEWKWDLLSATEFVVDELGNRASVADSDKLSMDVGFGLTGFYPSVEVDFRPHWGKSGALRGLLLGVCEMTFDTDRFALTWQSERILMSKEDGVVRFFAEARDWWGEGDCSEPRT